jgi:AraC-like DNA-binding protein
MQNILFISAGIALGLTVLSIIKLTTDYRRVLSARILVVFMLAGSSYVLAQITPPSSNINILLDCFATTVSPLFLFFSLAFFQTKEEPFDLKPLHYMIFIVSVSLGVWVSFQQHGESLHQVGLLIILNYLIKTSLVFTGIYFITKHWRNDLVQCRRNLRMGIVVITGLLVLFALTTELLFLEGNAPEFLSAITLCVIALISLLKAYWLMIENPDGFILSAEDIDKDPQLNIINNIRVDATDHEWLNRLNTVMQEESYFKNNELTIRALSSHIQIPEHHLRRLINQHLGYRNFNDYLNRFRIKEASERLVDPKQAKLPITTIAIESGYSSLTTFNKAFKLINDMTPSEFRKTAID